MISIVFRYYLCYEGTHRVREGGNNQNGPNADHPYTDPPSLQTRGGGAVFFFCIFFAPQPQTQHLPHLDPLSLRETVELVFYNRRREKGPKERDMCSLGPRWAFLKQILRVFLTIFN